MLSPVERAVIGTPEEITLGEFADLAIITPDAPVLGGQGYRVWFRDGACKIVLRADGTWVAGRGETPVDSRELAAFRAARIHGLFDS